MDIAHLAISQTVRLRPAITIPTGKGRVTDFISPKFVEAVIMGFTPGPDPHAVLVNLPVPVLQRPIGDCPNNGVTGL